MNSQITVYCLSTGNSQKESVELSSFCPCCGVHLSPRILYGILVDYDEDSENKIFLLNFCPECDECFISKHTYNEDEYAYNFHSSAPMSPSQHIFSSNISKLSPNFVRIYNEAFASDQLGFSSICGMGYRKALEFLVKDYIITQNPSLEKVVSSKMLGPCINDYLSDNRLKSLAKASTWIGNDETHYSRKHVDVGVKELKLFINAFVTFIDAELAYRDAEKLISKS